MNFKSLSLAVVTACAFAVPALAHHSFSMFDTSNAMTLTGTVKEFEWTNPHSWLRIAVEDPASHKVQNWSIELASVGQQARIGWTPTIVKPGDKVTVDIFPMKDGTRGGSLRMITLPNGAKLGHGGQIPNPREAHPLD